MAALPCSPGTSEICANLTSLCQSHRKTKTTLPRMLCGFFPEKRVSNIKSQSGHPCVTFYWSLILWAAAAQPPSAPLPVAHPITIADFHVCFILCTETTDTPVEYGSSSERLHHSTDTKRQTEICLAMLFIQYKNHPRGKNRYSSHPSNSAKPVSSSAIFLGGFRKPFPGKAGSSSPDSSFHQRASLFGLEQGEFYSCDLGRMVVFYFPSGLCSIMEVWILFHKLSRTSSSYCLHLPLSVVKLWLFMWPLPWFSRSRITALACKEIQEMILGLFSWLVTTEFICDEGHIDFFYYGISTLATVCLCVYYSIDNSQNFRALLLLCIAFS